MLFGDKLHNVLYSCEEGLGIIRLLWWLSCNQFESPKRRYLEPFVRKERLGRSTCERRTQEAGQHNGKNKKAQMLNKSSSNTKQR